MKIRHTQTVRLYVAIISTLLLAGCSSPKTFYYTLSASPQGSVSSSSAAARPDAGTANVAASSPISATADWTRPYSISSLTIPAQVDDTPLVVRQSSDQLMVLTYDRWTGPLKDQFKDALSQALTRELGMPPVQNLSLDATRTIDQIHVDVQRFDLLPGQAAVLDVVWQISPGAAGEAVVRDQKGVRSQARTSPARPRAMTCYSVLQTSSNVGVAALVLAQQRNVIDLAAQIAQTLRSGQPPASVRCI